MFLFYALVFILGLCLGSFLNVVIYRLPQKGVSIIHPKRSYCPKCRADIAWYDNLPVLSWVLLRGRCRHCRAGISPRYPLVELLCGILTLAVFLKFGFSFKGLAGIYFVLALTAISYIDLDRMIIPARLTLPGMIIGLAASLIAPDPMGMTGEWLGFNVVSVAMRSSWGLAAVWLFMALGSLMVLYFIASEFYFIAAGLEDIDDENDEAPETITVPVYLKTWIWLAFALLLILVAGGVWYGAPDLHPAIVKSLKSWLLRDFWSLSYFGSLLGFLLGWGLVWGIISAYAVLTGGKQGMGGGDMVLLAMIGVNLGWRSIFMTVFGASFIALGAYMVLAAKEKSFDFKARLPFGPFLSMAALIHMFFGETILTWYLTP